MNLLVGILNVLPLVTRPGRPTVASLRGDVSEVELFNSDVVDVGGQQMVAGEAVQRFTHPRLALFAGALLRDLVDDGGALRVAVFVEDERVEMTCVQIDTATSTSTMPGWIELTLIPKRPISSALTRHR